MKITMPPLDDVQREVIESTARFKVLPWGRRRGKSRLQICLALQAALERTGGAGGIVWWIWPSHKLGRVGWEHLKRVARPLEAAGLVRFYEVNRVVGCASGGEIQMKSADEPKTLVAEGLTRAIMDEAGIMQVKAFDESISPTLVDQRGDAVIGGVPKGRGGLLWYAHQMAADGDDWQEWRQTTFDSPHLPKEELERLHREYDRGRISEHIWRQEYLAEFLEESGAVFRGVVTAATAVEQSQAKPGHHYAFGVDWGKHQDFTAIAVWDIDEKALVALDRFNQIDYAYQRKRLEAMYERFRPLEIVAERNAMGEPIIEELQRQGLPVRPWVTSNATKADAVEALALDIENGVATLIPDPVLISELQGFERKETPTGRPKYDAPSGLHDDTVDAACIGYTAVRTGAVLDVEWA